MDLESALARIAALEAEIEQARRDDVVRPAGAGPKTQRIPGVKRGTSKRRAAVVVSDMNAFWNLPDEDRQMLHVVSRGGRRP